MLRIDKNLPVPVYRQVYTYFKEKIVSGAMPPGTCLPSIRQVQREQKIARESIKRAMGDLDADGFVRKIQGKGTFVAPQQTARRFWGIVVPFYTEFYNQMIVALSATAEKQGVSVDHACDYDNSDRQISLVNDFVWRKAEAIIVVPAQEERRVLPHLQKVARRQPLVLFDRTSIASQLPYVIQDYVLGVRIAMQRMRAAGAESIGYVRDPLWVKSNPLFKTMEEAYRLECEDSKDGYCHFWDSPYGITLADLEDRRFDALVCVNDEVACLTTGRLKQMGLRVPQDVQVAGYNHSDLGRYFTPTVTTTDPNLDRMCDLLVQIIERRRNGEEAETLQYVMIPTLVEGGTTAPLPKKKKK